MKQPYDERGKKVSRACPNPDCYGTLQDMGNGNWECDGLVDPNDPNKELEACTFTHQDGEPYNASAKQYATWAVSKGKVGYSPITGQQSALEQRITK
jgi:hypothetical protein